MNVYIYILYGMIIKYTIVHLRNGGATGMGTVKRRYRMKYCVQQTLANNWELCPRLWSLTSS